MAVYKIFPEKDAFINSKIPSGNAGKDEIVELGVTNDSINDPQVNRILMQFNTQEIDDVVQNKVGAADYRASIKMFLADAYQLPVDYTIYAYPVAQSWDNGTGKFGDIPTNTTGVSWTYTEAGEIVGWPLTFTPGITGSFQNTPGGGVWYYDLESTQLHPITSTHDVELDVTDAVKLYNPLATGSIDNNGFIIKLHEDLEFSTEHNISLKYFSADTNTIYPPYLEIKWDDSDYSPGGLQVVNSSNTIININNNKGKYPDIGKQRFRVSARPKYPVRQFTTSSIYINNYALPEESYWGLRDENTEEMIVDFDENYTKISADTTGGYFDVYMDGLQPERYYRLLVKTTLDGSTTVVDNQNIFKVVRNG